MIISPGWNFSFSPPPPAFATMGASKMPKARKVAWIKDFIEEWRWVTPRNAAAKVGFGSEWKNLLIIVVRGKLRERPEELLLQGEEQDHETTCLQPMGHLKTVCDPIRGRKCRIPFTALRANIYDLSEVIPKVDEDPEPR
jgi:hypothetical protein